MFTTQEKYGHFLVKKVTEIEEIQTTLTELEHVPTGAEILHLANEDEENLFNLSFRTWPEKSNGVAHILEHTVLCGSQKYPVRDPFFAMQRRSLNTFMNALTGADFTCYPAASQVEKDFYNLLEVYLDSVFRPKLTKISFLQEGHRLEFMDPENPNSPLLFKGIVFNEMKGAMATGEARLNEALMHTLFPNLTYGVNSGGDPKEILSLTYEELKDFHAKFYNPSRCLFFFYGNLPLKKHLDFLEKYAFKGIKKVPPLPFLPKQPRFHAKVEKTLAYPISEEEDPKNKTLVGMSWLTCPILEQEELQALCVLDIVLMGTDAAPLKKALLQSKLCKQADSMIDTEMSEVPFVLICKGCAKKNGAQLEEVVRTTLLDLVKKGLPSHLINGAIHQLEMARTEITGNNTPYGLHLFFRSGLLKQHGGNPEDGLRVHTLFEQLREKVKDPHYLTGLIEKHFLNNPHFALVVMHPDSKLAFKEIEEEETEIKKIATHLTNSAVKELLEQAKVLKKAQEKSEHENLNVLPKVTLGDVAHQGKEFSLIQENLEKFHLYYHPCFTNELIYADLVYDLPDIPEKDLSYFRLFAHLLPQVGCGGRNYQQHLEYLLQHTGGIGTTLDLGLQADDPAKMRPSLSIRGKALYRKMDKFFPIFRDIIISADFHDVSRLRELLIQHLHSLENSIQHSSLRYAVNLASRGFSVPATILNTWFGLDYYWALRSIVEDFENNPSILIDKLDALQTLCLGIEGGNLVLSCDKNTVHKLKSEHFYGLNEIPTKSFLPWKGDYQIIDTPSQGRITASPVAFTAFLFPSIPYIHSHAAALSIASEIMENKILHKRIREQGGAYGAGAVSSILSGQFYFYTYRDPYLAPSLKAFYESIDLVVKGKFSVDDIEEAELGLFQNIDSPTSPGNRGITAYGRLRGNRTPEIRQQFRQRLLEVTKEEIKEAAKEHLLTGMEKGILVTFAGKELLEKENIQLKEKLPLYSV